MKVRLLSFAQYRILFNNSEELHTTISMCMICIDNTFNEVIVEKMFL